jgi:23S rRNA-/tRNA-specific pseudouridylate synthase
MDFSDNILWSDEYLVVINKPTGIFVVADGYNPTVPT